MHTKVTFIYSHISINMLRNKRVYRHVHAQAQLISIVKQYLRVNVDAEFLKNEVNINIPNVLITNINILVKLCGNTT